MIRVFTFSCISIFLYTHPAATPAHQAAEQARVELAQAWADVYQLVAPHKRLHARVLTVENLHYFAPDNQENIGTYTQGLRKMYCTHLKFNRATPIPPHKFPVLKDTAYTWYRQHAPLLVTYGLQALRAYRQDGINGRGGHSNLPGSGIYHLSRVVNHCINTLWIMNELPQPNPELQSTLTRYLTFLAEHKNPASWTSANWWDDPQEQARICQQFCLPKSA